MTLRQLASNNVKRNLNTYIAYFLSCTFSVFIFFSFAASLFHPILFNSYEMGSAIFIALTIAEVIIFSFSFMFVFYSLDTFLKSRKKEFGILTILGMEKNDFNKLIFMESMIIGILAILTGIGIGIALLKLFLMFTSKFLGVENLYFYFPLKGIALTVISFSIIFILISIFTPKLINISKTVELLKSDKKPKKAPRSSILLGLLSIIMIGFGYYLGLNGDKYEQGFIPYLMVGFIVMGTLLFFNKFSILVLNLIKKNRKAYYKETNLLCISNLTYKIKDNGRMLFLVSIASTVAFVSVGLLYSMKSSQILTTKTHFPFGITYLSLENNDLEQNHISRIEELLNKEKFAYNRLQFDYMKDTMNGHKEFYIMQQSDFNKTAEALGMRKLNIDNGETILVSSYMDYRYWRKFIQEYKDVILDKNKKKFKVAGGIDRNIVPQGLMNTTMVVNDETFNTLRGIKETVYQFDIEKWTETGYIAEQLKSEFNKKYEDPFIILTAGDMYLVEMEQSNLLLYIGFFIAVVFFIGAGSFLYFRFFNDLNEDKEKYKNIVKLGLTQQELKKITTIEIGTLFFIPYIVAAIHSSVAIKIIAMSSQDVFKNKSLYVLAGFFIIQSIYFLGVRQRYNKHLIEYIG